MAGTKKGKPRMPMLSLVIATAIANAVIFLLTQDIAATPLVIIDVWFAPMLALLIIECLCGRLTKKAAGAKRTREKIAVALNTTNA
jgi:hypothetical protein